MCTCFILQEICWRQMYRKKVKCTSLSFMTIWTKSRQQESVPTSHNIYWLWMKGTPKGKQFLIFEFTELQIFSCFSRNLRMPWIRFFHIQYIKYKQFTIGRYCTFLLGPFKNSRWLILMYVDSSGIVVGCSEACGYERPPSVCIYRYLKTLRSPCASCEVYL